MIDAKYLSEFKRETNEDLLVAGLIESFIPTRKLTSILDIGSGTGLLTMAITNGLDRHAVSVVEPSKEFSYSTDWQVYRQKWEEFKSDDMYDLVILSHVIGDFEIASRSALIDKAVSCVAEDGYIVFVENGPMNQFDSIVQPFFESMGNEFNIDFTAILGSLQRANFSLSIRDIKTYLPLGRDLETASRNCNLFFPRVFDSDDRELISRYLDVVRIGDRFVVPVCQRMIVGHR